MAGLFDSLSSATSGLTAARLGLDVTGQNLANANTVGYTRRTLTLAETPATTVPGAGRGVTILGIEGQRDVYVEARLRTEAAGAAFDAAVLDGVTEVEASVGAPGQSIDASLARFFDAFSNLADDPMSAPARDAVVHEADRLGADFQTLSDRLVAARRNADLEMGASVNQINELAAEVARLNEQISAGGADVETLRDRREVAVSTLTALAGVTATTNEGGGVDLSIGSGRPLVNGASTYTVTATTSGPLGLTSLSLGGDDITAEITGGRIGGLLNVRDTMVPAYQAQLDQLAYDVAAAVNSAHHAGYDATGAAGGDFFAPLASVSGAAAALAVDPGIAADSRLVAASATGAVGDNGAARAIAALRDAAVVNGNRFTPSQAWGQIAFRIGADVESSRASNDTRAAVTSQLQRLRDQTSGVSMDEEAANLMRYQRAYEANARYFTTIVDTLDTLLNLVH
jgi:flagellar hook-associated protein 1 FlgK